MDLNLVRTFALVAETRSFSAAAVALQVPTSSVSRAVARLESALKTKLFERTTRKTALSATGKLYYEHVRKALAALADGELQLGELIGQPRGEVTITLPVNLDEGFFARQVVTFCRAYPEVRVNIVSANQMLDDCDLALRVMLKPATSPLLLRELGDFHAWLVASPTYLRLRGTPVRPEQLATHDFLNMTQSPMTIRLRSQRGSVGVEVRGPIVTNDMQLAVQLAAGGAGIGPLVFPPGEKRKLPHGLVRVLPAYVVEGPTLFLASASKRSQPLAVALLRDFLVKAYEAATP